jgi:hypothetical protein
MLEHEVAYLALRHTLLQGRVLRSKDPDGLEQEIWALLALCQALRREMVTAVETVPGTDPDRASFTTALEAAKKRPPQLAASSPPAPASPAGSGAPSSMTCCRPAPIRDTPGTMLTAAPGPLLPGIAVNPVPSARRGTLIRLGAG